MWKILGIVLWIFIGGYNKVNSEYFSVVGPKTLRVDEAYRVAVTSHNSLNQIISVGIEGTSFDGEEFEVSEDVEVDAGETKIVKLKVRKSFKLF
jgi:hypothetical protein